MSKGAPPKPASDASHNRRMRRYEHSVQVRSPQNLQTVHYDSLPRRSLQENKTLALRLIIFCTFYVYLNIVVGMIPFPDDGEEVAVTSWRKKPYYATKEAKSIMQTQQATQATNLQRRPKPEFPMSITDRDYEAIPHPAILYGANLPKDLSPTLTVPKFWTPPVYLDGALLSKEVALSMGSFWQGNETIFVSIASYRDPDCINTVESIYLRAAVPERIRTVVVEQRKDNDIKCTQPKVPCQQDPEQVLCKYSHLIHAYELDARLAVGPTFARHIAHRHYRGEYFALQIDSHVRFTQHFDSDIIQQWKSANNEMAVLSTYLLDLNGAIDPDTHNGTKTSRALLCNTYFEGPILKNGQQAATPVGIQGTPTIHPFWAAGFSFSRGHFIVQVPYDGYLPMIFQGEEISIAIRGFTFGYDYYAPERNVCFHMYALSKNREQRLKVPMFSENRKAYKGVEEKAMQRLTGIIQISPEPNDFVRIQEDLYGLGKARSPQTFYKTFGIYTDTKSTENNLCWFVGERMQRIFIPHLRPDGMGIDYSKLNYAFQDPAQGKPYH